jgi:DNA-binding ferritin-like protein
MEPYHKQIQQNLNESTTNNPITAVEGNVPERIRSKNSLELLKEVLAMLRALQWVEQTCHWQSKGQQSYQLHLLFQRLYENLDGEIDSLAEKLVGYYGNETVNSDDSINRSAKWVASWKGDNIVKVALEAEKQLQAVLRRTYDTMKQKKELTLGLDDYLMALANSHETHLYLLGQQNNS